jgi:soluble lytic murein transglycosylase-like protein
MANYHVNLLNNNRYRAFSGSVANFADRVKAGGYATDSKYVDKLNAAIASIQKGAKFVAPNTYVLDPYTDIVKEFTSKTYGPINLKEIKNRQAWVESNNNPNAIGRNGEIGTFQIKPALQKEYVLRTGHNGNLKDPEYNAAVRD